MDLNPRVWLRGDILAIGNDAGLNAEAKMPPLRGNPREVGAAQTKRAEKWNALCDKYRKPKPAAMTG